ncbi:hypothetical protein RB595_005097 [Gaeumannomyces hyphopodioides]
MIAGRISALIATTPTQSYLDVRRFLDYVPKLWKEESRRPWRLHYGVGTGKGYVFGEHAAVYGKPAITAAISLRSYLLVRTLSKSQRTGLLDAIKPHAGAVSPHLADDYKERKIHIHSATAFLYLLLSLGSRHSPGFVYTLRSTIPVGAGLGSSASVCVCLSTALLLQTQALAGPHRDQPLDEAEKQIERINSWAYAGELRIHGDPSGVDNTVSCRGKAVLFLKSPDGGPSSVTPLVDFPRLRLLVVDTKQPRTTAAQVDKVRALGASHPATVGLILDAIGTLTKKALKFISSSTASFGNGAGRRGGGGDDGDDDDDAVGSLGRLFCVNHGLLMALGASHPCLDRVCDLADHTGVGWTKLTGAGGGGCAIVLARPGVDENAVGLLEQKLNNEGFQKHEAFLGAAGVGVLWPAVFRNGPDGRMEEIDQGQFEGAPDARAIEQLVGIGGPEGREGWMFWNAG